MVKEDQQVFVTENFHVRFDDGHGIFTPRIDVREIDPATRRIGRWLFGFLLRESGYWEMI